MKIVNSVLARWLNLVPLFPIAKIVLLLALYLLTGDRSIFIFSISNISISFFIRFVSGNSFALTKKYFGLPEDLAAYRALCIGFAAISFVGYLIIDLFLPQIALALLIAASKLLESAITSLAFEMSLTRDRKLALLGYYFALLSIIFIVVTYFFNIVHAIVLDVVMMSIYVIINRASMGSMRLVFKRFCRLISANYEISANVFPVSAFIFWYSNVYEATQSDVVLLGYLALAISFGGFINRPISLWASHLDAVDFRVLTSVSHHIAVVAFILGIYHYWYQLSYFGYLFPAMYIICSAIQNFIRINLYSNKDIRLLRYHLLEALLILFAVSLGSPLIWTALLLMLTRTSRLTYISILHPRLIP